MTIGRVRSMRYTGLRYQTFMLTNNSTILLNKYTKNLASFSLL